MKRTSIFFLIILTLLFISCGNNKARTFTELSLNTICSITVYTDEDEDLVPGAFALMQELSQMIDMYDPSSELSEVNRAAYENPVKVSDELFSLIEYAYDVTVDTDGAFNIAIGPLVRLWGIGGGDEKRPSDEETEETLELVDWKDIVIDEQEHSIRFLKEGMLIDLSAVGKGYISEKVASYFRDNGAESAIINLGGNVYALGRHPGGRPWKIGLQNPDSERGGYYSTVECTDEAVVTSGGYERFFIDEDGTVYHHILDSDTGYPSSSDIISSSIISNDATLADMLSTACFVSGSEKAVAMAEYYGVKAVFLTKDGRGIRVGF